MLNCFWRFESQNSVEDQKFLTGNERKNSKKSCWRVLGFHWNCSEFKKKITNLKFRKDFEVQKYFEFFFIKNGHFLISKTKKNLDWLKENKIKIMNLENLIKFKNIWNFWILKFEELNKIKSKKFETFLLIVWLSTHSPFH